MPTPFGPIPSARQLAWHARPFYGFVHFGVNTFTDLEWGRGSEPPSIFAPTALDCRQWARTAREAGMGGLVLTAKHHDGFCLWPSRWTEHSVKHSPWRNGRGDVVREFVEACAAEGIKAGLYCSPWDRNHAEYGRPAYLEYYLRQLEELMTGYGELFEVWFDGANGGDGWYGGANETRQIDRKAYYDFPRLWAKVREWQPNAVIFSDGGPDIRWIGNEKGTAPDPCWATLCKDRVTVGAADTAYLANGDEQGTDWVPAEVDVSIRKGWFHHANEAPHSLDRLLSIWFRSVGLGNGLHLNVPPDRRGLFADADVVRLRELRACLDTNFAKDLAAGCSVSTTPDGARTVEFPRPVRVNCLWLEEAIEFGQRVAAFAVDVRADGAWRTVAEAGTIGARRVLPFPATRADAVRVRVTRALSEPIVKRVALFHAAQLPDATKG
jgi:alpha-L-fucosidase